MIGPVIVGAIRDRRIESVGLVIGANQMVGCGFTGGIRRVRRIRAVFIEGRIIGAERTIDLVGGNMVETMGRHGLPVDPKCLGGLEQRVRADHIRPNEIVRA